MRNISHVDVHDEALKHFGLKRDPFNWLPEKTADFFYSTDLGLIEVVLWKTIALPGICAITGEVGSGKSAGVRRFVEYHLTPQRQYVVSRVDAPMLRHLDGSHLCQKLLHDFKGDLHVGQGLMRITEAVRSVVEDLAAEAIQPVIVIEDAHLLPLQSLRDLKLLYELRQRIKPILAVVLIGQLELSMKMAREDMRQVFQRCRMYRLQGLKGDLVPYVKHRFKKVSAEATDFFEPEALKELVAHPGVRTPMEVNAIGSKALNLAWKQGEERVNRELMFTVLAAHEDEADSPVAALPEAAAAAVPASAGARKAVAA